MRKANAATTRLTALFGVLSAPALFAAPANLDLVVGAGLQYHDNAGLRSEDEESDLERRAFLEVGFDRPDPVLPVLLNYRVERSDFQDDIEDDRTAIEGASRLTWVALQRTLDFTVSHQISDQVQNRAGADVNSNRERRSIISASANGYAHLSKVDSIILTPQFSDVRLQDTTGSNSTHSALNLAWEHKLSAISALQLSGSKERARFDDSEDD